MNRLIISIILCITISLGVGHARILNVPDAYRTIQAGIDASQEGDTVLVEPGIYLENLNIAGRSITLVSRIVFNWNSEIQEVTIIDGRERGAVITLQNVRRSTIRGFTLRNGRNNVGGGIHAGRTIELLTLEDLRITDNQATLYGGGVYVDVGSSVHLRRSFFQGNSASIFGGGYNQESGGEALIEDCQFIGNSSGSDGGGVRTCTETTTVRNSLIARNRGCWSGAMFLSVELNLDRLTVVDNDASYPVPALYLRSEEGSSITNSIIYGNNSGSIWFSGRGVFQMSYCLIQNGRDDLHIDSPDPELIECFDSDPRFVDQENRDYHLRDDSPCIDAGNPDSESDPDESRADLGAFPLNPPGAWISGQVIRTSDGLPIPFPEIVTEYASRVSGDSLGFWSYFRPGIFERSRISLTFQPQGYLAEELTTEVGLFDLEWFDVSLERSRFQASEESIVAEVDSGAAIVNHITIRNPGDGPLTWSSKIKNVGDAGLEPFTLRESIEMSAIVDDERIQSAMFDGENLYISGANGDDENLVYILNRDWELVGGFPQPVSPRYGYKDLDWDGEYLWASGENWIVALTRDGDVARSFRDPLNPSRHIAIDRDGGIIWLSGTTTNIVACDLAGNSLDITINRAGFRIYGLAWLDDDPDTAGLFVLHQAFDGSAGKIYKIDTQTGDTTFVQTLPDGEGSLGYQGLFVCNNYDRYQGSVLMTVENRPLNFGSDRIVIYQLYQNESWVTLEPNRGEVAPGEELDIAIDLHTIDPGGLWNFSPGIYEGEILFANDGAGGEVSIPVSMTVLRPASVDENGVAAPSTFDLSVFPNPFNSMTTLTFSAGAQGLAPPRLAIYDLSGRLVSDLSISAATRQRAAVDQKAVWDASGLPGGIYFVRLEAGTQSKTIKTILMK